MQVTIRLPAASPRLYLEWVQWWRQVERFEAGLAREAVAGIDAGPTEPAVERVTPIFIRLIEATTLTLPFSGVTESTVPMVVPITWTCELR